MAIQTNPRWQRLRRRAAKTEGAQDNQLTFMDQAGFQLLRATGRGQLMQMLWIYEHPVDYEGLRRFHRNFGYGLAGRRIERSVLPFGRHRWVSSLGPVADLDIAEPRSRSEVSDWFDERAQVPVDPEWGPGWHMGVLPMTDGSTAVTLVGSHHLADGVAALLSVVEAVHGARRDLGYPPPRSRKRFRAAVTDLGQTVRGVPEAARTTVNAAKLGLQSRGEAAAPTTPTLSATGWPDPEARVVVPAVTALVDLAQWDTRAESLNGTSYSLVAGVAARLGERMGRKRADGKVTLVMALNGRTGLEDTRANAMLFASADIDPAPVTTDLDDARSTVRQALQTARDEPDPTLQLLPLVPFVPRRALKRVVEQFLGSGAELPVSCSNLGDVHPSVAYPDGTEAEYTMLRGVDQNVRRADLERAGGQLVVVAGRISGKIAIDIIGYQVGAENSKQRLRELAASTLAEFGLSGEII
ncbi:hypothetical protein ABQF17_16620 [Mycolicibacterium elephantis]|uniref:hypothetical protein n=1 Tax=Mycolicibacterium elephantis TaxID=81858 RepID=UPI0006297A4E|nr:hypothetical protein [Mycolicibacterium elephantis]KKW62954.1 hypothetical protein AAV95_19750 [Mycolicibacterium elephantis]OBA75541.1 hypothetical protein A5633_19695 [Mycolicibacterium elephantis]OBB28233.1 hypothetical protein A5762_06320 [Mycolicibacterium elephantis]OBE98301.1 hypothetical protein A5776_14900 [Mycolicibacterium elephantis]